MVYSDEQSGKSSHSRRNFFPDFLKLHTYTVLVNFFASLAGLQVSVNFLILSSVNHPVGVV